MKNRKGFTLIELLIVISIVGILAAIAVPQFILYRTGRLVQSGENLSEFYAEQYVKNYEKLHASFDPAISAKVKDKYDYLLKLRGQAANPAAGNKREQRTGLSPEQRRLAEILLAVCKTQKEILAAEQQAAIAKDANVQEVYKIGDSIKGTESSIRELEIYLNMR